MLLCRGWRQPSAASATSTIPVGLQRQMGTVPADGPVTGTAPTAEMPPGAPQMAYDPMMMMQLMQLLLVMILRLIWQQELKCFIRQHLEHS